MKTKKSLFMLYFMINLSVIGGCENEVYPEAIIVKEFPKINVIGNNTESIIIQSQRELEAVFTHEELQLVTDFQQINFSKYTLLLGYGKYGNEVSNMEHSFVKTGMSTYTYLLKLAGSATRPDSFRFGILVLKLPKSVKVTFKIEELNLKN